MISSLTRNSSLRSLVADYGILLGHCRSSTVVLATKSTAAAATRTYVTRAHPQPKPVYPIIEALELVFDDVTQRRAKRERKERIYNERLAKHKENPNPDPKYTGKTMPPWTRGHPDETIELALNLNLDPRKPGQALRGSLILPHGTGRKAGNCVVFTENEAAQEMARAAGAYLVGGEELVDQIVSGEIPIDTLQSSIAMPDIMPVLTKKASRLLGPRKLMPNVKVGNVVDNTDDLVAAVQAQVAGKEVMYRTETDGIVHVPVGKHSFGLDKILENIGAVVHEIFNVRPDSYGKGKQKKAAKKGQALKKTQPQYVLCAHVCSTQSPGFRVELRTLDPTSPFFLTSLDPIPTAVAA